MLFDPFQPSYSVGNQMGGTKIVANQDKSIAAELFYPPTTQDVLYSPPTTREEVAKTTSIVYVLLIFF